MPITLIPVISDSAIATPTDVTIDGRKVVRAAIPSHETCAIRLKQKIVHSDKGQDIVIEWQFVDPAGNPLDLSQFVDGDPVDASECSISLSVGKVSYNIRARFRTCDIACATLPIYESAGSVVDFANSLVHFPVPPELATVGGIAKVQVAIVRCDNCRPICVNTFLWAIEEGLFGDDAKHSGVPTFSELRTHLRDTAIENDLLQDVEFDDQELVSAMVRPVEYWNEIPPPLRIFTCQNFPFRYHWLEATVGELLRTGAHHYMRNNLNVNHGGVSGNFKHKYQEYIAYAKEYEQIWKSFVEHKKVEINAAGGIASLGSPYNAW